MKNVVIGFILLSALVGCHKPNTKVSNVQTFAKMYGYVRWFYPGDEASSINWDKFAVYGIQKVENARNEKELKRILLELFKPIAPALRIEDANESQNFNLNSIIPKDTTDLKPVSWVHYGVYLGIKSNIYQSIRVNRDSTKDKKISINNFIPDMAKYRGKEVKLVVSLKTFNPAGEKANLFLVSLNNPGSNYIDLLRNEKHTVEITNQWNKFEISLRVKEHDTYIICGLGFDFPGPLYFSDFALMVKEGNGWKPIKFQKNWNKNSFLYEFETDSAKKVNGELVTKIYPKTFGIKIGSHIQKDIGNKLVCSMPLTLYGNREHTFPISEAKSLSQLKKHLAKINDSDLTAANYFVKLANVVIAWNVLQHFYPYFDVVPVDWEKVLPETIQDVLVVRNEPEYFKALSKMVAKLEDGHGVVYNDHINQWGLPIAVAWIESNVVITASNSTLFNRGDIIKRIDKKTALEELTEQGSLISGSPQLKRYRALNMFGSDFLKSDVLVTLIRDGKEVKIKTKRQTQCNIFYNLVNQRSLGSLVLGKGIYYENSSQTDFDKEFNKLATSQGIIFSSFFQPGNLISHLISTPVWSATWRVPVTTCPDRRNISYDTSRRKIEPEKPFLKAKVVFIEEPFNVSYGETLLGIIDFYKLGKLVGDTTAGTNGNVNFISLMGNYSIMWTGMRVLKHDGSQLHLVGFRPDYPVKRTIKAIKEGRDEYLEKAVEVMKKEINHQ